MSPIHIRANEYELAPVVLLVGDPGRASRAAGRMEDCKRYNEFRGLLGYTGRHRGVAVSVQTTGMGCPSAAIVCEELAMLGAQVLIRLGTCGATRSEIKPADLIVATSACPLDGTTRAYLGDDPFAPTASFRVVQELVKAAQSLGVSHHVGPIATEDALYAVGEGWTARWAARGILGQEMEASIIFTIAALRGMEAGCALVASNYAGQHERLPDEQLLPAIDRMIDVGLEAAVALSA